MNDFYDTSVFVAAFREDHPEHEASVRLFSRADKRHSAVFVSECVSVSTGMLG